MTDALGEALHLLRMSGTFYCRTELTEPWGLTMPDMADCLWFHVLTSGRCEIEVAGRITELEPGDVLLVPGGEGHRLFSAPNAEAPLVTTLPHTFETNNYAILRHGGEGGGGESGGECGGDKGEGRGGGGGDKGDGRGGGGEGGYSGRGGEDEGGGGAEGGSGSGVGDSSGGSSAGSGSGSSAGGSGGGGSGVGSRGEGGGGSRGGHGGDVTHLVCGAVRFDHPAAKHLINVLPHVLYVRRADDMRATIDLMAAEARNLRPGGEAVITRLADVLVIQTIRSWLANDPAARTGWLGALQDKQIGQALALIHRDPAKPWTVERLAHHTAMSRSAFAARFTDLVGEPAMRYVTRWRMHVAMNRLRERDSTVSEIARGLGYESEAAFSRAFKRIVGVSPGQARAG